MLNFAITGHYIDEKTCSLKSILFECSLLERSHTGLYLAEELLRVTNEWDVSNNIIMAVSDNGSNIKKQ